jgi:hypothetical protein
MSLWIAVVLLGAYHGVNPGMGWLFAVAHGLQEKRRSAVIRALGPIALGHEASIAAVVVALGLLAAVLDERTLRIGAATVLLAFGLFKLLRPRWHPRWVGMRVSSRELTFWSFLMSTAHGAGLMLIPLIVGFPGAAKLTSGDNDIPVLHLSLPALAQDGLAVMLHTAAMLLVMGFVALLVYDKLGLNVLRRAWLNLDLIWAGAFVLAGVLTLAT